MTTIPQMTDSFRKRLVEIFVQREQLLFCFWLTFYAGRLSDGGSWRPAYNLNNKRAAHLINGLRDDQLNELSYRLIIPWRFQEPGYLYPESCCQQYLGVHGARIVYDYERNVTLYHLCNSDTFFRLLPGDLDLLAIAGFPGEITDVLMVLWNRIAPAVPYTKYCDTLTLKREYLTNLPLDSAALHTQV
jgi:hypothetical protein